MGVCVRVSFVDFSFVHIRKNMNIVIITRFHAHFSRTENSIVRLWNSHTCQDVSILIPCTQRIICGKRSFGWIKQAAHTDRCQMIRAGFSVICLSLKNLYRNAFATKTHITIRSVFHFHITWFIIINHLNQMKHVQEPQIFGWPIDLQRSESPRNKTVHKEKMVSAISARQHWKFKHWIPQIMPTRRFFFSQNLAVWFKRTFRHMQLDKVFSPHNSFPRSIFSLQTDHSRRQRMFWSQSTCA